MDAWRVYELRIQSRFRCWPVEGHSRVHLRRVELIQSGWSRMNAADDDRLEEGRTVLGRGVGNNCISMSTMGCGRGEERRSKSE